MLVDNITDCNTLRIGGYANMTMWYERLRLRMKERKVTQEKLASILNISQGSVGHYVSGRRNPRKEVMEKIADELEVSLDWLAGKTDTPPIDKRDFYSVPVLSAATAAYKIIKEDEEPMGFAPVSTDWMRNHNLTASDLCVCIVEDDGMSPKLNTGDKVVIDRGCTNFTNGDVFALLVNDKLHIRRVVKRYDNSWTVSSDNNSPIYRDETLNADIQNEVQIIGRVMLAITSF